MADGTGLRTPTRNGCTLFGSISALGIPIGESTEGCLPPARLLESYESFSKSCAESHTQRCGPKLLRSRLVLASSRLHDLVFRLYEPCSSTAGAASAVAT